jgi:hypothetical protein
MKCLAKTHIHEGCDDMSNENCGCKIVIESCQKEGTHPSPVGSYAFEKGDLCCEEHSKLFA